MDMITINGKTYKAVELDFNNVCRMERMGAPISEISTNIMSTLRAYIALCMRKPIEIAGREIEAHIVAGGSLKEIIEDFNAKVEESGFFQALRKNSEEQEATEAAEIEEISEA